LRGRRGSAGGREGIVHFLDVHLLAVFERVWRVENDPIVRLEPVKNFEAGAVIAADGERLQACVVIGIDHYGAESFGAEEQRVHGNLEALGLDFDQKMNLGVAAGQQLRGFVGHIHFGEERTGG